MRLVATICLLAIALAGCSQDTTTQDTREEVPAGASEAAPSSPFARAETQMNQQMMAAQGANAAEAWVRKMIEHHRGGVAMSEILIAQGGDHQDLIATARSTAEDQRREIQELETMLQSGVGGEGAPNAYETAERQMHQQMMAASGSDLAETWARKMIEHHRGAVAMADIVIAQGGNEQVSAMARRARDKQNRDIQELERMLQG